MNGTSMASPHVCGAVALLISGLRHENLKWSPFSIKRALASTARPLPHLCPYGQGHGLMQVIFRKYTSEDITSIARKLMQNYNNSYNTTIRSA